MFRYLAITAVVAAAVTAAPGSAQSSPDAPALVALVYPVSDTTPRVVVLRRAASQPDVIVLREDASPADLASGVALLARSRALDGATVSHTQRLRLRSFAPQGELPPGLLRTLEQALRRIRNGPVDSIPGVGPARHGLLAMSPFRHRGD